MTPAPSLLQGLRQSGADQFDPVRFRYLESLELRLQAKGLTEGRHWQALRQAVADYTARSHQPETAFQTSTAPKGSPLADLLKVLDQSSDAPAPMYRSALEERVFGGARTAEHKPTAHNSGAPRPLKAMARVKAEQGSRRVQARIRQAIESPPKEAGPMNAHRLVSRAIAEMQALSPEYLKRFANYADTLMALERLGRKG